MPGQILLSGTTCESGRTFRDFYEHDVGYGTVETAEKLELHDAETGEPVGAIALVHVGFTDINQSYGLRLEPNISAEEQIRDDTIIRQMIAQALEGLQSIGEV
jgi:hypothetical protein